MMSNPQAPSIPSQQQPPVPQQLTPEQIENQILSISLSKIKEQSYLINTEIELNKYSDVIKETNIMLNELRTSKLSPKNYYHLYTSIFDQMQYLENFFKDEIRRGRNVKDLYRSIQHSRYITPRMYLQITAGKVYIQTINDSASFVLFDLLNSIKGIAHPIRGLFARYYLLKMMKDHLPDTGNEYCNEKSTLNHTVKFILENLEEMNRLWYRLSMNTEGEEKMKKENERTELQTLIGENITRLSNLNGLTIEDYKKEILPKIFTILIESQDKLSQQYLLECIINAFPDEFNIYCMDKLMEGINKLANNIDVVAVYKTLMDKVSKFICNEGEKDENIMKQCDNVFNVLKKNIDYLIQEFSFKNRGNSNVEGIIRIVDLCGSFLKFSIKVCTKEERLKGVNQILETVNSLLLGISNRIDKNGIKAIQRLLFIPLESNLNLFDLERFPDLMSHLDFQSHSSLSIQIVENFISRFPNELISTVTQCKKFLDFIKPLLEEIPDSPEIPEYQFEYEQSTVAKISFIMLNKDPRVLIEIYTELKNVFSNTSPNRKKITLPSLCNSIIKFCYQLSTAYDKKQQNVQSTQIFADFINTYDLSFIDSDESFYNFMLSIYKLLNEIITNISQFDYYKGLKLYLECALQVNSIQSNKNQFEEACASFINAGLGLFNEGKYDQNLKYNMITDIIATLLNIKILPKDFLTNTINNIQQIAMGMSRRNEQCNTILGVSNLFYNILNDKKKTYECISKAKKFAEFSMTNPKNLNLFVLILNKILYYFEVDDEDFIGNEIVEDIIESIKNHLQTIKVESEERSFLPPIEEYFNYTVNTIKYRKKIGIKKVYQQINI